MELHTGQRQITATEALKLIKTEGYKTMTSTIMKPWLNFRLWQLRRQVLHTWQKHGETSDCQRELTPQARKLASTLSRHPLLDAANRQLQRALTQDPHHHQLVCLPELASWQIALHSLPQGQQIPPHAHPNTINILLPLSGELKLVQYSLLAGTLQRNTHGKQQILPAGSHCIGLTSLDNVHGIQASNPDTLFLSIRLQMAKQTCRRNSFRMLCCKLGLLLSVIGTNNAYACDDIAPAKSNQAQARPQTIPADAPSIHQLSLKYLHGEGVPVNRKKATRLAYQAAKQGYRPSQQLYDDLLNGFYDEMTGC